MKRPRILLADDHPMMCTVLGKMLEVDHDVIGCVQDGRTLVNSAADLKPDLVVLDVGLPVLSGLDAGRQLKSLMPGIRLVCFRAGGNRRAGLVDLIPLAPAGVEVVGQSLCGLSYGELGSFKG
jgi:CheY-like chemotaxis protein